jgi:hypothetical protein
MTITSNELWDGIHTIGMEGDTAHDVAPSVIAKLVELKFGTHRSWPTTTDKGERARVVMESGDVNMPKFNDFPPAGL